jgi:hypothetical protein
VKAGPVPRAGGGELVGVRRVGAGSSGAPGGAATDTVHVAVARVSGAVRVAPVRGVVELVR